MTKADAKQVVDAVDRLTVAVRELTVATVCQGAPPSVADQRLHEIRELVARRSE